MSDDANKNAPSIRMRALKVTGGYAAFSAAWILVSGLFLHITVGDPVWQERIEIAKGLLFVLVTGGLLYFILKAWDSQAELEQARAEKMTISARGMWRMTLMFVAMVLAVPLIGYLVIYFHAPAMEKEVFSNLSSVAELKAKQIENWLEERRNVGVAMLANDGFIRSVADLQHDGSPARLRYLRNRLEAIERAHGFDAVMLVSPQGVPLLPLHAGHHLSHSTRALLQEAITKNHILRSSVYIDESENMYMDFIVPLRLERGKGAPVGAAILHVHPERFLFPYIQHWPSATSTGETLLARQDGDKVVFLNRLRHQSQSERRVRIPFPNPHNPAAVAIATRTIGEMRGTDYRNEPVLAAYQPIAGTQWVIIAKIDAAEVMQPLSRLGWWVMLISFVAFLFLAIVLFLLWRQQQRTHQLELDRQAQQLVSHFYNLPFIGMTILSPNNLMLMKFNETLCHILGYSRDELSATNWNTILHPEARDRMRQAFDRVIAREVNGFVMETQLIRLDGQVVSAAVNVQCVRKADGSPEHFVTTVQNITERKQDEARIQRLTKLYSALSHCNQTIVRCTSEAELFSEICRIAVEFGGMRMAWIGMTDLEKGSVDLAASFGDFGDYPDSDKTLADLKAYIMRGPIAVAMRSGEPVWTQDIMQDASGMPEQARVAHLGVRSMAFLPLHKDGETVGIFVLYAADVNAFDTEAQNLLNEMAIDVGFALSNFAKERARRQAEAQLRLASNVFASSGEAFVITDENEHILMVNKAFCSITGYQDEEVIGQTPRILASGHQTALFYREMWANINAQGHWQGEVLNRKKDGSLYVAWLSITRVTDDAGKLTQYIGIACDITRQKANEEKLNWLAHFDTLTGLPNRTLLNDRCAKAISLSQRSEEPLALMFLDLDHFKNINESLGYRLGDELLTQLGKRLSDSLRAQDTVSRLGGDDFVIVLPRTDIDEAARLAERLLRISVQPYYIGEHEFTITTSIGIAMYPDNGTDLEALSRCADAAMYSAKHNGRNTFRFYTPEMQAHTLRKLQLENALRRALERNELSLVYQPQVSIDNRYVVGAEVLLRWRHPEFGMISPNEFIPIAESSGLILPIGEWVLRTAALQMKAWVNRELGLKRISINLSPVQFRQANLTEAITRILSETELSPEYLELELTESAAMENPEKAIEVMDRMHANGIRMSIDDFGTGYSSLAHLKRFKVYKLKIDRAFVRDIASDPDDRAIVVAVINLASSLNLKTIAEGVESEEQQEFLRINGCDEVQGYLTGKPQTAEQLEGFLEMRRVDQYASH